ncbi:Phospholipase_D-nuclease N-terminal [Dethiosulfatibacter aminovorans DSM 17477]|uniref:Phospholipase_D-nuclease N-terminal n=1 Tax=Dethiosulfatibacter aminovorans DSM 17477 TaxID=1121476 RepID=A0A1M6I1H2_9FIRM|nr:PLD nuclease N-terminal domain-containing protein [Dethiosulfatibacter aminovorans]SHJ28295.1 Phospholipase_D-nuclease N-terminal [Dethiosulfatibacter aminovorans DSM 17477]
MNELLNLQNLALIMPLALLQIGLLIFCIQKIIREGTRNLSKPLWILIVVFINLLGPVMYLFLGRNENV